MSDTGGPPTNILADPQMQRATFTSDLARKPLSPVRRQGRKTVRPGRDKCQSAI